MKYFISITLLALASPAFAYSGYESAGGFAVFASFLTLVVAILQIILFFKLWGMTNDVKRIKEKMIPSLSESITEELNILHLMGKDDECEELILRDFYHKLLESVRQAKSRLLEDTYATQIDKPIAEVIEVVAKQYAFIGREMPDAIKNLKTYKDFLDTCISEEDIAYPYNMGLFLTAEK